MATKKTATKKTETPKKAAAKKTPVKKATAAKKAPVKKTSTPSRPAAKKTSTPSRSSAKKTSAKKTTTSKSVSSESVKFTKLGGEAREFPLSDEGMTLGALLELAEENTQGYGTFVNGEQADAETMLEDGDIVSLVPGIKAG